MLDFDKDELKILVSVFKGDASSLGDAASKAELLDRIESELAEREEMESMDFNECGDGACKL